MSSLRLVPPVLTLTDTHKHTHVHKYTHIQTHIQLTRVVKSENVIPEVGSTSANHDLYLEVFTQFLAKLGSLESKFTGWYDY